MSRFGVFSLLLVLGLDWGTSAKQGCHDPFCKQQFSDESGFREASSSDSLLKTLVWPLFYGSSSEDTSLRKFHSKDWDKHVKKSLTETVGEDEEAEHGFRYHHHHLYHPEHTKETTTPEPRDLSFRAPDNRPQTTRGFSKKSNIMCKYLKAALRKVIEFIRPFFG